MADGAVLVVGSINVDLVVAVDRLPVEGETVIGGTFARHGGGKGANQAVAAARAGARTALVGAVGDDAHGREVLDELRAEGVDVDGVAVLDGPTGVAAIVVDARGANQIAVASGANARVPPGLVAGAAARVRYDALLVNHELDDDANQAAVHDARGRGAWIVVNPAPARSLTPALLAAGPLLTPNAAEAAALSGERDPSAAARALAAATGAPVVVTMGAQGALLADGDSVALVAAPRVAAVDTTGAGDVLCGTLTAALAAGAPVGAAVQRAVAAATRSVTLAGARGRAR
jgi:ribokinase